MGKGTNMVGPEGGQMEKTHFRKVRAEWGKIETSQVVQKYNNRIIE